jgi:anti-sigma regulatory factor (Ser/Thr protein kinase)
MIEGLPGALSIRIASDLAMVRPFRKMFEALLAAQGWGEEPVEDAALVATEVVQNAIEHGSRGDGSEEVQIVLGLGSGVCVLAVTDPGTGRDPDLLLARDVTLPPDLASPRGRGLFLIHRMSARFERLRSGSGCLVRVRLEVPQA